MYTEHTSLLHQRGDNKSGLKYYYTLGIQYITVKSPRRSLTLKKKKNSAAKLRRKVDVIGNIEKPQPFYEKVIFWPSISLKIYQSQIKVLWN